MQLKVAPLTCAGCARKVTQALQGIDPQVAVEFDMEQGTVLVRGKLTQEEAVVVLSAAGFQTQAAAGIASCCNTGSRCSDRG